MDVTAADLARMPAENARLPVGEFGIVWAAAERVHDERARRVIEDWYGAGVVVTCRWLARAAVRTASGSARPARAPVTKRTAMATPELVEAELLAAEMLDGRRPVPAWLAARPGWSAGIVATLSWAWAGSGVPPVEAESRTES